MLIPRKEYPRPDMVRNDWINLNGEWEFEIDNGASGKEREFYKRQHLNQKIIVPFVPESKLSGIENTDFMKSVWYKRNFIIPDSWSQGRILVHFGAVDYLAEVWINGKYAGTHKGGYTPFEFDITNLINTAENVIVVNAYDDVKNPLQPTGKQCTEYYNKECCYTRSTGIWQTVWLEHVPDLFIKHFKLIPDIDNSCLHIRAEFNRNAENKPLYITASLFGRETGHCVIKTSGASAFATLNLNELKLWNIADPVLYDLEMKIGEDAIKSYFGMRKININGHCIEINGKSVFQRLILDQGYYPDGIYTAPDDDDIKNDIKLSMAAGFNGARMHMKIFDPRYIYWADKLGYIVWGEFPNWGLDESDERALLAMLPEWIEELRRDYNHPSIVGWCPFNETRTQRIEMLFKTVYYITKEIDSTRPVIDTSGYVHAITDVYDVHDYDQNPESFKERYSKLNAGEAFVNYPSIEKYDGQPYFVSEFGGTWWNAEGNKDGWGYGMSPKNIEEFYSRYESLVSTLLDNPDICAFCYTQLTDVMQEQNGIYTFDRKPKFDIERIREINSRKAAIEM